jgi:hypothetical protein
MNRSNFIFRTGLVILTLLLFAVAYAGLPEGEKKKVRLNKTADNDVYAAILINNIFSYHSNNGDGSFNPFIGDGSFEFPNGAGGATLFEDGPVWGGFHNGVKKVGGSAYRHGIQAGPIVTPGTTTTSPSAANPGDPQYHVYRVRPDINPSTTLADVQQKLEDEEVPYLERFEGSTITASYLYQQYIDDWNNWPASQGAPYADVNSNGTYEPATDIPGVPGADQTLWHVGNDLDAGRTTFLYGSVPVGLEFQRTIWAYKRTGALGNTVFISYKLINKSGFAYDSVYFSQWSDPDLGGANGYLDDFTGCDIGRSLGYVYNGDGFDGFYGKKPPAVGFDFFQGPIVPSAPTDSGVFYGKYRKGVTNLGMSAFNFFINGSTVYIDPRQGNINGTNDWYNLMNGLVGRTGAQYIDPTTGLPTKFVLSGDPVSNQGWTEGGAGGVASPGDRRMASITGPFMMADGDTQEVVVAAIAGLGADRLSSISVLRFYSDQAQAAYDLLFDLPAPPPNPVVTVSNLDNQAIISWADPDAAAATENFVSKNYTFQGYNVYQFPTAAAANGKLLFTFDKVDGIGKIYDDLFDEAAGIVLNRPSQTGNDNGVQRYLTVTDDAITGKKLVNGRSYYFAVTAYSYNATLVPHALESQAQVVQVVPQALRPGDALNAAAGDTIPSANISLFGTGVAPTAGSMTARVVDPSRVTGHQYVVHFTGSGASKTYSIKDSTTGVVKATGVNSYGDVATAPIVDGVQFVVLDPGAAGGIVSVLATNIGGTPQPGAGTVVLRSGANTANVWAIDVQGSTNNATAYSRMNWQNNAGSSDYEIRITPNDATASEFYTDVGGFLNGGPKAATRIPVQVWNVTTNTRLIVQVLDDNANGAYNTTAALSGVGSLVGWERIYVSSEIPYSEPLPATAPVEAGPNALLGRIVFADWANAGGFPPAGTVIRVTTNKPLAAAHSFTLSTAGMGVTTGSAALAKAAVEKVNVYPNPYFGFNTDETSKYQRFITFNHLPTKATIRIYTLSGVLVRTIVKDNASQFQTWDLQNSSALPVASGIYVAHVDMPEQGVQKTLKLSIVQETQILDHY